MAEPLKWYDDEPGNPRGIKARGEGPRWSHPLYTAWNALAFVSVQPGRQAKTLALRSFLPVLFFTATIWSALWAVVIWSVAMIVSLLAF